MDSKLHLVTVDSPEEEEAVLHALSEWPSVPASHLVPLRRSDLPRFNCIAQRCNRETAITSVVPSDVEMRTADDPTTTNVPDVLVTGSTVDPVLSELAAALCHREVVSLNDVAQGRAKLSNARTAMVLWAPDGTPMRTIVTGIEALGERDIRIGLVPCFGTDADRWALLKALSFPVLPNRGKQWVISSSLNGPNAPDCVRDHDGDVPSILRSSPDILAFEGHGNPQDIFVGRNAVLCARQGVEPSASVSTRGLFPCYHDGVCFRRAFRLPDAELISGDALDGLLLFALTCYYVQLGKSPYSQSSGLVPGIMNGTAVAAIAAPAIVWSDPSLLVAGLSLIHEGLALADVAHVLDRLMRHTLGLSTGLPPMIPALAVFGNPCARFQPLALNDGNVVERRDTSLIVQAPSATPELGAFLCVRLTGPDESVRSWSIEGLAEGGWARSSRLEVHKQQRLYLWLGQQGVNGRETIRLVPLNQPEAHPETIRSFIRAMEFWPLFVDYCLEVREGRKGDLKPLEETLIALPRWRSRFRKLAQTASCSDAAAIADGNARSEQAFERALARMCDFSISVLELSTEILSFDGLNNDVGAYESLLNGASDLQSGRCACGQSEIRSHQWLPFCVGDPEAYRHACPCASAGLDSCRYDVSWSSSPATVQLSETLRLSLLVKAADDLYLIFVARAVLVRPAHDRGISGPVIGGLLAPSQAREITCELVIPADISPGLHEVSLLAIINGSLVQRCYMIDVLAPAPMGVVT